MSDSESSPGSSASGPSSVPGASASGGRPPAVTPARLAAGICLAVPFAVLLWVPSYNRIEPTLGGIPFFYWYQLLWIPLTVALTVAAYVLVRRDARRRSLR